MPKKVLAIDPEALIFTTAVYVRLHLPDPPDVSREKIRATVQTMTARERATALKELDAFMTYAKQWKRALNAAK